MTRSQSARIASSSSTHSSGGNPPFDRPSDIEPRETMKRTPISAAAPIWSSTRQPLRNR